MGTAHAYTTRHTFVIKSMSLSRIYTHNRAHNIVAKTCQFYDVHSKSKHRSKQFH